MRTNAAKEKRDVKLVATAGNMKGGQRGLWKAHLDLLWLKVWAQSKVSDPLVDCDPLDCGAFKQKSQVLRLLVRSRSDQVRAMTNTMQSQYLANTFNLKVLYLNSPRSKWCMLFIGTWYICWPTWENSFYTPCNARQSIIPPWPLSCCCDMVTQ